MNLKLKTLVRFYCTCGRRLEKFWSRELRANAATLR